jgi:hypothetical protein
VFVESGPPPGSGFLDRRTRANSLQARRVGVRSSPGRSMAICSHVDRISVFRLPESIAGCEECLRIGSPWVHLRMCMTCGRIGCCDSSPNRHASRHARKESHPIVRSAEPGEDWSWCFVDDLAFLVEPTTASADPFEGDAKP